MVQHSVADPRAACHASTAASQPHTTRDAPTAPPPERVAPDLLPLSIISDCLLLSEGTIALLSALLPLSLIRHYTAEQLAESAPPNPPGHVVLLDSNLAPAALTAWLRFWRSRVPPAHTIVLGIGPDPERILALIEAGASAYTPRQASALEVAETIRAVQQGGTPCSPEVAAYLFARLADLSTRHQGHEPGASPLTARELEVLRLIAADRSNKDIAAALVIEVRTVKHHVHNILEKLQLRHRWEAARAALERGWIEESSRQN